uniref:Uncharacterized protein n=1 Tax=Arundo donax TaxID=35708 RepID=A0A0A8XN72_ARUDO
MPDDGRRWPRASGCAARGGGSWARSGGLSLVAVATAWRGRDRRPVGLVGWSRHKAGPRGGRVLGPRAGAMELDGPRGCSATASGGCGAAGARPREVGGHGRGGGQVACRVRSWLHSDGACLDNVGGAVGPRGRRLVPTAEAVPTLGAWSGGGMAACSAARPRGGGMAVKRCVWWWWDVTMWSIG